jgi:hypothetical protein
MGALKKVFNVSKLRHLVKLLVMPMMLLYAFHFKTMSLAHHTQQYAAKLVLSDHTRSAFIRR